MRKAVLVTLATVAAAFMSCSYPTMTKNDSPTMESPYFLGANSTALQRILIVEDSSGSMENLVSNARAVCKNVFDIDITEVNITPGEGDTEAVPARMLDAMDPEIFMLMQAVNDVGNNGVHIKDNDMLYLLYLSKDAKLHAVWFSLEEGIGSSDIPSGS